MSTFPQYQPPQSPSGVSDSRPTTPDASYGAQAYGYVPVYAITPNSKHHRRQEAMARTGGEPTGMASFAHYSFFFLWIIGSALTYFSARPGSYLRRQAARAFNWQLIASAALMFSTVVFDGIFGTISRHIPGGALLGSAAGLLDFSITVGVIVLTIVGAVKAAQGRDWQYPFASVEKIRVLKEES